MSWQTNGPILVPYDFSKHADAAVRQAIEIAQDTDQIHVLHVTPHVMPPGVPHVAVNQDEAAVYCESLMRERIPYSEFGIANMEVLKGDAGVVTADRATELQAELVVVGSHGRTGLSRVLMGSVAERIIRLAPCPVLVVKLDESESEFVPAVRSSVTTT